MNGRDTQDKNLADAFRRWGYLCADLDAFGRLKPLEHPDIIDASRSADSEAVARWRSVYAGPIGVEFMHMLDRERVHWVAERLEAEPPAPDREQILKSLSSAELFERFLHARYVGSKRYSIEGVAGVIPLLESILDSFAGEAGELVVIAMSHRGRLNVLANIVGIPESDIFAGQEDVDPKSVLGGGDVKYHLGATGTHRTWSGGEIRVHLVSNPSHLEAVNPVVMGRVRAKQDRRGTDGRRKVLSITLHGDAAFAGQGVTAETLNMADLSGYQVGGTVHIIVNNLIGFTAEPRELHSTRYASDLGRRLNIPIVHVNGEEPEAIVRAGRFVTEYRDEFASDVIVDLIGYRRYGHSEVEDPSTTQPLLYAKIKDHPMLFESFAEAMGVGQDELEPMRKKIWEHLEAEQEVGRRREQRPLMRTMPPYWDAYHGGLRGGEPDPDTAVPAERIREIAERMTAVPDGFALHPKIKRLFDQRMKMATGEKRIDWGTAEALAFGSLLWEGIPVRLAGEDSRRGTFNQRYAAVVDIENGSQYMPLANLRDGQGRFTVVDSPLSEMAGLGFEYGYSRDFPDALVMWEAQFGDFANGAQTIIDQFICAGEDKWRLLSGIVLLLPHGYEGQGPEHSSARLERFLQLAAEDNIQVCQPATSGQYFHLLRKQALQAWRKPMIIMTPKSLLRSEPASSPLKVLTEKSRVPLAGENEGIDAERLMFCSGKIYHELCAERERRGDKATAIVCIVDLYPFPERAVREELARQPNARKVLWVQEEPANMGALSYVRPILQRLAGDRHVTTVKRSASASPATGSAKAHALEQQALIRLAFA